MNGREQANTEQFITQSVNAYIKSREKAWDDRVQVQRVWNWTFAVIAFASIVMCGWGVRFFIAQGEKWDEHIALQNRLSVERAEREKIKAKQDSIMAVTWVEQMKQYNKMPYYRKK